MVEDDISPVKMRSSIDSIGPTVVQHVPGKPDSRDAIKAARFPGSGQNQQDLELVPGSVFLVDSNGSILKLPIPSDDPNDPLRWGRWKRAGAFFCITFFRILGFSMVQFPVVNFHLLQADPAIAVSDSQVFRHKGVKIRSRSLLTGNY